MSNEKKEPSSQKFTSDTKNFVKKMFEFKNRINILISALILAVGIALGMVFDEFELFFAISVAIDVIIAFINNESNNI